MKKYASTITSLGLVVVSFFAMGMGQSVGAMAGAGSGTNRQIATLKDLHEVVACEDLTGLNSFTFVENGEMSSEAETSEGTKRVTVNKVMTGYFTQEARYYASKGTSAREEPSRREASYFDVYVYISKEENTALVKFNEYFSATTEEGEDGEEEKSYAMIKPSKKGIWIECPRDVVEVLNLVDNVNTSAFRTLGEYLEEAAEGEDSELSREEDVYTLEKTMEGGKMSLLYDLSKPATPYMQIVAYSDEDILQYSSTSSVYSQMEFRNIGNTTIRGDIKADYVCKDLEEFEDLFSVKE